jgi:orotidine-5'-phosphate decarboxylase
MFVVGATQTNYFQKIRSLAPKHYLLVPGIGAQGGNLEETLLAGINDDGGLLINASRSILFASKGNDFAQAAAREAQALQQGMEKVMRQKMLI